MATQEDPRINYVRTKIKSYPDFPQKGIDFKDLFSAMRDTTALVHLIELVKEKARLNIPTYGIAVVGFH